MLSLQKENITKKTSAMKTVPVFFMYMLAIFVMTSCKQHSETERMENLLAEADSMNKNYVLFSTDSVMKKVVSYYNLKGDYNKKMKATYLLGCCYRDMGDAPQAMDCYLQALEQADTTDTNCDYGTLRGIYGQMAIMYHQQNLPYDELKARKKYIECAKKLNDQLDCINGYLQLTAPYYLLEKKDSVLKIIQNAYMQYKKLGKQTEASCTLPTAIYICVERMQYEKAKQLIDDFENNSNLFDGLGNIAKGKEYYYYIKGFYYLQTEKTDSAELLFRRLVSFKYKADAYRGLLQVFRKSNSNDSIVKYSLLYEEALDSLHNEMTTEIIHKMTAMYDYTRNQKLAKKKEEEAQNFYDLLRDACIIALLLVFVIYLLYKKYRTKKKEIEKILEEYKFTKKELIFLKSRNYEALIKEKEDKEENLRQIIKKLQANKRQENFVPQDDLAALSNSKIALLFTKKSLHKTERTVPNTAEWNLMVNQFCKDMPATYDAFCHAKLSELELHVCILLVLKFTESSIAELTGKKLETISNAKLRANKKTFNNASATTLKSNLIKLVSKSSI